VFSPIHQGLDQAGLVADQLHYDATIRNLELIGEAATHVPEAVREENKDIPWRLIIATRNRLIHGYLGIDNDTLWSIVQQDIPALLPKLRALRDAVQTTLKSGCSNDDE
jgi:uncharacterized protein with HEPN domain